MAKNAKTELSRLIAHGFDSDQVVPLNEAEAAKAGQDRAVMFLKSDQVKGGADKTMKAELFYICLQPVTVQDAYADGYRERVKLAKKAGETCSTANSRASDVTRFIKNYREHPEKTLEILRDSRDWQVSKKDLPLKDSRGGNKGKGENKEAPKVEPIKTTTDHNLLITCITTAAERLVELGKAQDAPMLEFLGMSFIVAYQSAKGEWDKTLPRFMENGTLNTAAIREELGITPKQKKVA